MICKPKHKEQPMTCFHVKIQSNLTTEQSETIRQIIAGNARFLSFVTKHELWKATNGKMIYLYDRKLDAMKEAGIGFDVFEKVYIFSMDGVERWTQSEDIADFFHDKEEEVVMAHLKSGEDLYKAKSSYDEFIYGEKDYLLSKLQDEDIAYIAESELELPDKGEFVHYACCCGHESDIIFFSCPDCGRKDHLELVHDVWWHDCCGNVRKYNDE